MLRLMLFVDELLDSGPSPFPVSLLTWFALNPTPTPPFIHSSYELLLPGFRLLFSPLRPPVVDVVDLHTYVIDPVFCAESLNL